MSDQFISGIYNYCDRWCEKCSLTARCRVFAAERAREQGDDYYAEFWKSFDEATRRNVQEWTDDMLGDEVVDDEERQPSFPDPEAWKDEEELDEAPDQDPLVEDGMEYGRLASDWLKTHGLVDEEVEESCGAGAAMPVKGYEEAVEIVHWYVYQIGIKLSRSITSLLDLHNEIAEEFGDDEECFNDGMRDAFSNAARTDRDGSAKVALIGIERSLGAWTILREQFPEHDETIRDFQRRLARLRRTIDNRLPGARVFRRPGFDDA